jgi:hypothetical protein
MPKVICIPDTSAYWHLKGVTVGGKDIRGWLASEFEVRVTDAIWQELQDNRKDLDVATGTLNELAEHPVNRVNLSPSVRNALSNLIDSAITNFDDEELSCVVLGLRLLIQRQSEVRHVIVLSDDFYAFESEQAHRFLAVVPSFCFWNSADFVLYLAIRVGGRGRPNLSYEVFQQALETALYNSSPMASVSLISQRVREKWAQRFQNYRRWLERAFRASGFSW